MTPSPAQPNRSVFSSQRKLREFLSQAHSDTLNEVEAEMAALWRYATPAPVEPAQLERQRTASSRLSVRRRKQQPWDVGPGKPWDVSSPNDRTAEEMGVPPPTERPRLPQSESRLMLAV